MGHGKDTDHEEVSGPVSLPRCEVGPDPDGKDTRGTDVGGYVGNEYEAAGHAGGEQTSIGDDQRRQGMTATLTPPPAATIPAADERCDRCNAAGKLRIVLAGGGELVFCGHHANKYADDLVKITVDYTVEPDFTWRGSELIAKS